MRKVSSPSVLLAAALAFVSGCGDDHGDGHDHGNEAEVITTVQLIFTPVGGGTAVVVEFDDADGDGGDAPTVDPIELAPGMYELAVGFENRLETPAEIITQEIIDESAEHQLFFTGTAVDGPASAREGAPLNHAYADQDPNDLPIGLANTIAAVAGSGQLTVTLRHLPPVNDVAVKTATLASEVSAGGFASIAGSTDAQVEFTVTVE